MRSNILKNKLWFDPELLFLRDWFGKQKLVGTEDKKFIIG